jgi:hypothetical protein
VTARWTLCFLTQLRRPKFVAYVVRSIKQPNQIAAASHWPP